jgi:hypothetical protein
MELALGKQCTDRCRHHLDDDLSCRLLERGFKRDGAEQDEDNGTDESRNTERDQRIQHVVAPAPRLFEAHMARQGDQKWQSGGDKDKKAKPVEIKAQIPKLHRHQHGQREDQRTTAGTPQIAQGGSRRGWLMVAPG